MISPFTDLRVGLSPNSSHETERDICGGTPRKDFIPREVEQTSLLIVFSLEFKGEVGVAAVILSTRGTSWRMKS